MVVVVIVRVLAIAGVVIWPVSLVWLSRLVEGRVLSLNEFPP